jgi:FlaA1/EpsC-like NDP-sugar epimerase
LERNEIQFDYDKIKSIVSDKTILITGAAGSIGSEIVRQLIPFSYKKLILLDNAETPLYYVNNEVSAMLDSKKFEIIVGDICNKKKMESVFDDFSIDIVFHAAAYKHVPLMEENPSEAVRTNILGTKILADLSKKKNIDKFIMISTDKAVNPTSVMGASKRAAEIYVQTLNKTSETKFITTRFGNVLGSNGSVIPLFRKQIESGGPVTITHPEVTRFFMTIPEACRLVLVAGSLGEGGEIFMFDMGESVKIYDLAKKMIRLSGLTLGKDIQIQFTGLRAGEKLYEELLADKEKTIPTQHQQIMIAKVRDYEMSEVDSAIENILVNNYSGDENLVAMLKELIPEYKSQNSSFEKLDG